MLKKVTEVEGISEFSLDNGLRVLFFPDQSKQTVTVNITYLVGSRHEGYGEAGMAHLLEHMLFKGTPTFGDIPKALKDRGAQMNGTTSFDRTNYFETLAAGDENLEFALHLEADRMVNSFIAEEDLRSEMSVVRSEFKRGENNPLQVLMQNVLSSSYRWHNYGKTTIGNLSDIENVPASKLREFYKKHYRPSNAILVVAGNFDEAFASERIEHYFSTISNPDQELDSTYTDEPPQQGQKEVTIKRVGEVGFCAAAFHIPAGSDSEFAAIDVLVGILSDQPGGRLYKNLVENQKAANAFSYAFSLHDPGILFNAAMVAADGDLHEVEKEMLGTIWDLQKNPVSEEEVERSKNQLMKQWEDHFADSQQAAVSMTEWAALGDWRLMFLHRDRVEKVSAEDVMAVAKKYLIRENCTLGRFVPSPQNVGVEVPRPKDVSELLNGYQGRKELAEGEVFDPTYENIIRRTHLAKSASMNLAMLPKKTRGETVELRMALGYGNPESLKGLNVESNLLPTLMLRGSEKYSFQQIDDLLVRLKAELSITGSAGKIHVRLSTKRKMFLESLDLLGELLRNSVFPEEQFQILTQQNITRLETKLTDPGSLAANRVTKTLSPYDEDDIRFTPSIPGQIEEVRNGSLDRLIRLFQEQVSSQNVAVSVVGDFDPETTEKKFEEILDGWNSEVPFQRSLSKDFGVPGSSIQIDTPGKENGVLYGGRRLPFKSMDPEFYALTIANHILGGGGLSSRLAEQVRQKEGLSYSVGSSLRASNFQAYGTASVYAICNPIDGQKLQKSVKSVYQELCENGVDEAELKAAKTSYLENGKRSRNDDAVIARILLEAMEADLDLDEYRVREQTIQNLGLAEVNKIGREYLNIDEFVSVFAGDLSSLNQELTS